jgi:alkylated DNA repair dioxygenase AlkB
MLVLPKGVRHIPGHLDRDEQQAFWSKTSGRWCVQAPLYRPEMPRSGKPFSVRMTNCGDAGLGGRQGRLPLSGPASGHRRAMAARFPTAAAEALGPI